MRRREFLQAGGALCAATTACGPAGDENPELGAHVVDRVEFGVANYRWPRLVGKNARLGVHGQDKKLRYVRLQTNQGASGWGMVSGASTDEEAALGETVRGKTLASLIDPSEGTAAGVHRAFDFALHDLAGVILNQPVYQMLGAAGPKEADVYSGMIYLDELEPEDNPAGVEKVMENCRWDYDYGYRQLKAKIGRSGKWYPHDEGLAMDIRIVKMIHEQFGDRVDILVDANDMYSLEDAMAFLDGVDGVPIYWIEEPFEETLEDGRKLKQWMMANGREQTYYADGERAPKHEVCLQLAGEGVLDVHLVDIVGHGMTPWRRLMPELIKRDTLASPHAWGALLKTHYSAHISAGLGNVCTLEGVTCESDEIDFGDYPIENGKLRVSDAPGFGMKLL
jgi:L-alanine-DL-glutamate epimerase-like enolase superfamily enzyme